MPAIFFKSDSLGKVFFLQDVSSLDFKDLAILRAELEVDIGRMQSKMHQQRDTADSDWLVSISYKISVCKKFLELCNQFMHTVGHRKLFDYFYRSVEKECGELTASNCLVMARKKLNKTDGAES